MKCKSLLGASHHSVFCLSINFVSFSHSALATLLYYSLPCLFSFPHSGPTLSASDQTIKMQDIVGKSITLEPAGITNNYSVS